MSSSHSCRQPAKVYCSSSRSLKTRLLFRSKVFSIGVVTDLEKFCLHQSFVCYSGQGKSHGKQVQKVVELLVVARSSKASYL